MNKQLLSQRIETGLQLLWGVTFLLFPVFYLTLTTDPFILPKEFLLAFVVLISLLGWGVQMLLQQQVRIRRTPLDIPLLLFTAAIVLSSIFSANRTDSLLASAVVVYGMLAYFVLVNLFKTRKTALFFLSSLIGGGVLATLVTVLTKYHMYVLPFASAKTANFTPLGTYMEYSLYMLMLLPIVVAFLTPIVKKQLTARVGVFAVAGLVFLAGLFVAFVTLSTTQKPVLLPFDNGFQTAFAAISQDSGRVLQTFLFGEGYGNFATVFSRFHNASLNTNPQLWFLSFSNSSSFLLELLATTGLVGVLSFLFLAYKALTPVKKMRKNPYFLSLVVAFILSALVPFSSVEVLLLFFLLAGFTLSQREQFPQEYFDIELKFVALKKGVVSFTTLETTQEVRPDKHPTPAAGFVALLALIVALGYYTTTFAMSDATFQQSLVAANQNNGTVTYRLQTQAIALFPFRSDYYRIFSQTNIALANSLLSLQTGKNAPSANSQQTAYALVQQGITTARQATTLAPQSPIAWQNLSSVYRALIGVGQNAQDFAVQAAQQATVLDSANPQEYLNLGGLYYQIGQYDNAIRMFQQAIALKNDYANAYYNLGHAYEQKGDLQSALTAYQAVRNLVANDKANAAKIDAEIAALQARIGNGTNAPTTTPTSSTTQQPLALPQSNQLPAQKQQVPLVSPTPSK